MIRVFRIVKSEDLGETVLLTLARDGIEDPKANAVVLDDDDLPSGTKNTNYEFEGDKRPKVMVNGVEMFLKTFIDKPKYSVTPADIVNGLTMWTGSMGITTHSLGDAAKHFSIVLDENQLTIEVAWE